MVGHRWRDFDFYMVITTAILMGFGAVAIWSADGGGAPRFSNLGVRQAAFGIVGLGVMIVVANIDYRIFASFAWVFYLATIGLLVLILQLGVIIGGSQRWFDFKVFTLQPSEIGKLATVLALSAFIASRGTAMQDFGNFILSGLIVAVPMLLVYREPDLGSTLVYGVIWFSTMIVARTRRRYWVLLATLAIPFAYVVWTHFLHGYMKERLFVSYNPYSDPRGDGYNIIQARISIGSGGWVGHGLAGGTQSQLELLRVRTTDFIFAHASGMFGYLGMLALFVSLAILLWRCLRVAEAAKDSFGQCLAVGITGILFFQSFVNIGMNVGLMPVTGIPLPFVSYGSSSLWTFLIGEGILQSILMRHRKLAFQAT